jgi:hypothetical protein
MALTRLASQYLDLSPLSKIIVGYDYAEALDSVRTNGEVSNAATANDFGEGAAMALTVREGDQLRKVVVVWTPLIERLFDESDPLSSASLQSFMHELVHVDDHAHLDKTFPGGALATTPDSDLHGALLEIVMPARAEYDATRRTAAYEVQTGFQFLDMLEAVLAAFKAEVLSERRRYNLRSIDLNEFWSWLQERCRFVFQALGYALGHADGVLNSEAAAPNIKNAYEERLRGLSELEMGWLVPETRAAVVPLFEQEAWTSLAGFAPLIAVAEKLLNESGVSLQPQPGGFWVDVPPGWDSELQ